MSRSHIRLLCVILAIVTYAACARNASNVRNEGGTIEDLIGEVVAGDGKASAFLLRTYERGDFVIRPSGIGLELWTLEGMIVGIDGRLLSDNISYDLPMLEVATYDIIALPTGERPIVGWVYAYDLEYISLRTLGGELYYIEGDSKLDFSHLDGAKVWVVGGISPSLAEPREHWIDVEEYGLIREGPHTIEVDRDVVKHEK
jgi:hypothetical protein